jgi:hypothetical protein
MMPSVSRRVVVVMNIPLNHHNGVQYKENDKESQYNIIFNIIFLLEH